MNRYQITDRKSAGSLDALLASIARSDAAGVEMIQVREKDLEARALCELVTRVVSVCRNARVLVNSRVDVALACGAHGAHLPGGSMAPSAWRPITPAGFLIGVSCHDLDELQAAEAGGADFAVFGPVFRPLSKQDDRPCWGLEGLRRAAGSVELPVYALGGITWENAGSCVEAGAAGVAGITLFR
ncbi:thiamine phosphate synthase [Paludibaculum fermentans]|uniref:Thiamine phosphate synthase n=1 Tax=Paludibaculum fermentans TaxID=1473598 RepID=A0A7S7NU06_PALFE|nr:thiamine phosphate synthase [Paludibaculum fermentans]QOY89810.1 thiamine phosphate synthase [Paludibaculum fermentans]